MAAIVLSGNKRSPPLPATCVLPFRKWVVRLTCTTRYQREHCRPRSGVRASVDSRYVHSTETQLDNKRLNAAQHFCGMAEKSTLALTDAPRATKFGLPATDRSDCANIRNLFQIGFGLPGLAQIHRGKAGEEVAEQRCVRRPGRGAPGGPVGTRTRRPPARPHPRSLSFRANALL